MRGGGGPLERREVVVVGGGPAGAATAIRLGRAGRDVLILERAPAWRWRACGVFTSPASVAALRRLGVPDAEIERVTRKIPAMRVETVRGTTFRLTYGDDGSLDASAVALDRSAFDPLLIDLARRAGAEVRAGASVRGVDRGVVTLVDGPALTARAVVGADGLRSVVARDAGVVRDPPLGGRPALTFHVEEPTSAIDRSRDARMIVFDGGYVGLAPVPGRRVNVGIVLIDDRWRDRLKRDGAAVTAAAVMAEIPPAGDDPVDWKAPRICDAIEGAAPVSTRVKRRAGDGWLLVGDAAGFLDPFTGEGLHRAFQTAALGASAVDRFFAGDTGALRRYDASIVALTRTKDLVSRLVQAFVARPAAFERPARRLAIDGELRETMGRVIGDLAPASSALDPRFLARLLRP